MPAVGSGARSSPGLGPTEPTETRTATWASSAWAQALEPTAHSRGPGRPRAPESSPSDLLLSGRATPHFVLLPLPVPSSGGLLGGHEKFLNKCVEHRVPSAPGTRGDSEPNGRWGDGSGLVACSEHLCRKPQEANLTRKTAELPSVPNST